MAGGAIFRGRRVHCAFPPILGHFAVAGQTKGRLPLFLVTGVGRAMAAMTGHALLFLGRFMLELIPTHLGFYLRMAAETNFPRLAFDEMVLIRTMRTVTSETIALGKRWVGGFFQLFPDQFIMAG